MVLEIRLTRGKVALVDKNFPIFVPGRGVPGVVQHSLPLAIPQRTGHVIASGRRSGLLRALVRTSLPALLLLLPSAALIIGAGLAVAL